MRDRTLFVLGAGASKEVTFPDGRELAKLIASDLDIRFGDFGQGMKSGSLEIASAIRRHAPHDANDYFLAAGQVAAGLPFANSIDTFLDSHKDNPRMQLCGKLAIVKSILESEQRSTLYLDPNRNRFDPVSFPLVEDTWFGKLFRSLSDGISRSNPAALFERIAFINFNYDRCIEHFFMHAVQARFALSEKEAIQVVMRHLRVIHPYGTIGPLPWQKSHSSVDFGGAQFYPDVILPLTQS